MACDPTVIPPTRKQWLLIIAISVLLGLVCSAIIVTAIYGSPVWQEILKQLESFEFWRTHNNSTIIINTTPIGG